MGRGAADLYDGFEWGNTIRNTRFYQKEEPKPNPHSYMHRMVVKFHTRMGTLNLGPMSIRGERDNGLNQNRDRNNLTQFQIFISHFWPVPGLSEITLSVLIQVWKFSLPTGRSSRWSLLVYNLFFKKPKCYLCQRSKVSFFWTANSNTV